MPVLINGVDVSNIKPAKIGIKFSLPSRVQIAYDPGNVNEYLILGVLEDLVCRIKERLRKTGQTVEFKNFKGQ